MKDSTIESLAYRIRQAKENKQPRPIVFLGAGASKTGGIPSADGIVKDILERYKGNPEVRALKEEERDYPKLMNCLTPTERNGLLKKYIDRAKINVTHIYLAQMIHLGYVDYVLTVNFDNLMLRALALYNEFPPTYDMAILKDLTTTNFREKSVLYLHGQHHGLWLLNTDEEMNKVKEFIPPVLNKITNQRMWIFIGYSGYDPIFKHVVNLGRFDNGLYWVCYKDNNPNENVCTGLLDKPNTNAFVIKGYDSDSFILKLNQELKLPQPSIFETPFTSLKESLANIVDIDDEEHFKGVKERLEVVRSQVETAINQFEKNIVAPESDQKTEAEINRLKKEISSMIVNKDFDEAEINTIEKSVAGLNDAELKTQLSDLYLNWAYEIQLSAEQKNNEILLWQICGKYEKGISLNPKNEIAFSNWGIALSDLARLKNDETLFKQSFEKYEKAVALNPKYAEAFYNWGNALSDLAKLKNDETLFKQSFEKYEKAVALNPKYAEFFNNWGTALSDLARLKNDETLFKQSFEKYEKAVALNPKDAEAFSNWGTALSDLARLKNDETLFKQSIEKYEKAVALNPKYAEAFYNWGNALLGLARLKDDETLFKQSIEKYEKAVALNPKYAEFFNNWGTALSDLAKLKNDETLFTQSFEKYEKAIALNPKYADAFNNWGYTILELSKLNKDESLYRQSFEKLTKAVELGGSSYNLSYAYALTKDKENALKYLKNALEKNEYSVQFTENDEDWKEFLDDEDFKKLLDKYR